MSVVVGYVSSREGQAALRAAVQECLLRGCGLVVVQTPRVPGEGDDTELAAARTRLEAKGLSLQSADGEGHDPAEDLIDAVESYGGELIVIGLRRRTPIGKLILGSNAQRILLDAPVPVLAVKAEG